MLTYIVRSPCLLFVGAFADRYGRKSAALLSLAGWVVFGSSMIACSIPGLISPDNKWNVILIAVAISSIFNTWTPVITSMAADMSDRNLEARNVYMSVVTISEKAGNLVGFSLGFWMLTLVLTDYKFVW